MDYGESFGHVVLLVPPFSRYSFTFLNLSIITWIREEEEIRTQ